MVSVMRKREELNTTFPSDFAIAEEAMPLLKTYGRELENQKTFSGFLLLCVLHGLRDIVPFCRTLKKAGAEIIVAIKEVSYRPEVVRALESVIKVFTPRVDAPVNLEEVLEFAWEVCKERNLNLIVIEDGGAVGSLMYENSKFGELLCRCKGFVEQTTKGKWKYQNLEEEGILNHPVYSVASSMLKRLEAEWVAESLIRSIKDHLSKIGCASYNKHFAVIGTGILGEAVARMAKSEANVVTCCDVNPLKVSRAQAANLSINKLDNVIKQADVIVGVTGKRSIHKHHLLKAKNGAIFVSGTSEQIEIDVDFLETYATKREISDCVTEYRIFGKSIIILSHGFPANIFKREGIPEEKLDPILTELILCAATIAENGEKLPPIILELPESLEERIVRLDLQIRGIEFDDLKPNHTSFFDWLEKGDFFSAYSIIPFWSKLSANERLQLVKEVIEAKNK